MLGAHQLAQHVVLAPRVVLEAELVLRIDRVHLALDVLAVEQRRDEELRETIQRGRQAARLDIEEIVRVVDRGVGVVRAAVRADEFLVLAGIGILRRPQEQHVLQEVRQPLARARVVAAAGAHVQAGGRLVGLRIRDQQHAHAVRQFEIAVFAAVLLAPDHCRLARRRARAGRQQHEQQHQDEGLRHANCGHCDSRRRIADICVRPPGRAAGSLRRFRRRRAGVRARPGAHRGLDERGERDGEKRPPHAPDRTEHEHREDDRDRVQVVGLGEQQGTSTLPSRIWITR